jgi:hypothetical protein
VQAAENRIAASRGIVRGDGNEHQRGVYEHHGTTLKIFQRHVGHLG